MSDYIRRTDAIEAVRKWADADGDICWYGAIDKAIEVLQSLPSADAVPIHEEGTLEVKVPNAQKVGRVLVMDTESHIGGGLFYPDDAVQGEWIPCCEKMPKELERVNVTWLNHNPPFYYQHIKDIPQTDTAVYYRGKWYWWDATVIDILAEYGEDSNAEQIDKDIEVVAWMPLPKPYKGGDDE